MAKTRKIRLSSKVSVSFDAFWNVFPSKEMLYLLPSLRIRTFSKSVTFGLPRFILQFNWLYILADINVFIEGEIVMSEFIERVSEMRKAQNRCKMSRTRDSKFHRDMLEREVDFILSKYIKEDKIF